MIRGYVPFSEKQILDVLIRERKGNEENRYGSKIRIDRLVVYADLDQVTAGTGPPAGKKAGCRCRMEGRMLSEHADQYDLSFRAAAHLMNRALDELGSTHLNNKCFQFE